MEVLAVIPARGGSKGIPRKNIRLLNGKPLIYYQIKNALESKYINDIVVTSDDEDILDYASNFDVYLRKRPPELAKDDITLDPVVYDAVNYMEHILMKKYDMVVTLQPTSPLLKPETLENGGRHMPQVLYKNAKLTIHQRKMIKESKKSIRVLAKELGVTPKTVWKWKHREDPEDASCQPKKIGTVWEG